MHLSSTRLTLVLAALIALAAMGLAGTAAAGNPNKLTICHISSDYPYAQTISVDSSAWKAHQAHGDYQGACATIEVKKVTDPTTDPGKFNLFINGTQVATDVGNGGDSYPRAVTPGSTSNWTAEGAGTATSLSSFNSSYVCKDGATTVAWGSGTATPDTLVATAGHNVICTFTNQHKPTTVELLKNTAPQDASLWNFSISDGNATTYQTYTNQTTPFDSGAQAIAPTAFELDEWAGTGSDIASYDVSASCTDNGNPLTLTAQGYSGDHYYVYYNGVQDTHVYACTFTNTSKISVQVKKDTAPSADGTLWNFVVTDGNSQTFNSYSDQSVPFDSGVQTVLGAANIEIDEWAGSGTSFDNFLASVSCTDNGNPLTPTTAQYYASNSRYYVYFAAQPGHAYVCSFTNTEETAQTSGNAYFTAYSLARGVAFSVNEKSQAGSYIYADANGGYYTATISCVMIQGSTAYFGGTVDSGATDPSWVGNFLSVKVIDGSPDQISASFVAADPCPTLGTVNPPDGPFDLTGGDIVVVGGPQ